jgi:hypothetical protein
MSLFSKLRGTIETLFQLGLGGPQFKNNAAVIECRDSADATFVNARGADPVGVNDFATKQYIDGMIPAYFGDGSDGTATFNGVAIPAGTILAGSTYTLQRDVYYSAATVSTAITVITAGWKFFVRNTLTLTGTAVLDNSGGAGGAGGVGVGGTAGADAGNATLGAGPNVMGGAGGLAAGGSNGGSTTLNGWGGNGGAGQAGTAGGGGGGGTPTHTGKNANLPHISSDMTGGVTQAPGGVFSSIQGGGGGGGGGGGTTNGGGGGGGPGGVMMVAARIITGTGNLQANGGAGGAHAGTGGDGGGGGGGVVLLLYRDKSGWTGAILVNGGASVGGTAGNNGNSVQLQG